MARRKRGVSYNCGYVCPRIAPRFPIAGHTF